ncbi:hypothetical protein HIH35_005167 [Escherichia coli]|nr:hypothetical protein [Escherichia coli]EFI9816262.1 hypothetical protein [Escherichia coli]
MSNSSDSDQTVQAVRLPIMWDKQTKGSARCDLLSWKDPGVQVRIPVSINSACAT